jgi:hypothetical protein
MLNPMKAYQTPLTGDDKKRYDDTYDKVFRSKPVVETEEDLEDYLSKQ